MHVSSATSLPRGTPPDIVAATPAALMHATEEAGQYAGWEWTKDGIVARWALPDPRNVMDILAARQHPWLSQGTFTDPEV